MSAYSPYPPRAGTACLAIAQLGARGAARERGNEQLRTGILRRCWLVENAASPSSPRRLLATDGRRAVLACGGQKPVLSTSIEFAFHFSILLIGQYFTVVEDFYTLPCKSQLVGIYVASKISNLKQWPFEGTIKKKCLRVPWKKTKILLYLYYILMNDRKTDYILTQKIF